MRSRTRNSSFYWSPDHLMLEAECCEQKRKTRLLASLPFLGWLIRATVICGRTITKSAQGLLPTQLHITVVCLSSLMLCLYDLSTYLKIRVSNCEGKDIIMCHRAWVPNTLGSTLGIGLALLVNILTLGHKLRNFHPGKLALIFNTYKPFYCNKFYTTRKLDINLDFDE